MPSPVLKHLLNVWPLGGYPHGGAAGEWTREQKLAAIKDAGFDGFQGSFSEKLNPASSDLMV